jgi:iron(III) transport system substrate-binding protein
MMRSLMGLVVCVLIAGCGPSAAPAPAAKAPSAAGAPPASGAPSAASAPAPAVGAAASSQSDAAYRQQVIDGARVEGQVNAAIQSAWTPDGIKQLEEAIQREFGVAIKINFTPVQNYIQRFAELSSELAADTTPSFDLNQTSDANAVMMLDQNLLEAVNWPALLPKGTPPAVVKGDNRLVVVYTDHSGLIYDPTVISEAEAPRSFKDLGNPKWRGKFMLWQYSSAYIPWIVHLGRDQTVGALRAAMQNGAVADTFANEFTRFTAKEYPMIANIGSYYYTAQLRGVPSAFTPLDLSSNADHFVVVPRKAAHPNAAKLLAAVLVGPEGQRIADAHVGYSSRYYEGSADSRLEQAARAAGFPSFVWWESPEAKAIALSPEGQEIQKEIERVLQGG